MVVEGEGYRLIKGDCTEILPALPSASVDAVISDPPYPEIDREYGRMTETEWFDMMRKVVTETRRILKPTGSAVFILQPNSERVGKMRGWLWRFMAWCCDEWNMVQDAYWWNYATPPTVHTHEANGLMRPSMKTVIWLGNPDCYRNQNGVLLKPAESSLRDGRINRHDLGYSPSGLSMRHGRALTRMIERDGATPFNVTVCSNSDYIDSAGSHGHGAGTPQALADWWTRYLCPKGGTVADWFAGSGTMGISAMKYGCKFIGTEQYLPYFDMATRRLYEASRSARGLPKQLTDTATHTDLPLFAEAGSD